MSPGDFVMVKNHPTVPCQGPMKVLAVGQTYFVVGLAAGNKRTLLVRKDDARWSNYEAG